MPAFGRMSLVTPVYQASDIAFVRARSAAAPGFGGWRVAFDPEGAPEQVLVTPPGSEEPRFVVTRAPREVVLHRIRPERNGEQEEIERFEGVRQAVLVLCPIGAEVVEQINEALERDFPRRGR